MAVTYVKDLEADLAKLGSYESAWKSLKEKSSWAADTINGAANSVVGRGWAGPASERYDGHRRKLVADVDKCADLAGRAATAVNACIHTLRFNQAQLDNEKSKLQGKVRMSVDSDGVVTLDPQDEDEDELVEKLVKAYNDIRARVDAQLAPQTAAFRAAVTEFKTLESTWTRRTLRTLNWNVQQGGNGNKFRAKQGYQNGDMGELAQRVIDGKVDVATLQELFGSGAKKLQEELNERDPNGNWEVHFGPASWKGQARYLGIPADFGNAVAVRTGSGLIATGDPTVTDLGPGDEKRSATRVRVIVDR
ncbi:hypothetical protein [Nocardia goodfellowii]|uniref:WXG100 family type VII secretion target n=1 Tax=Nocardia goodfellowii TaxID=882446 RepID=A0ABS4QMU8_9NOCA|nr:hypothetical protein [Nocardia goodfellowii]MBP2193038.1 hypothetical protein [Nocardia goodfellowii]